MSENENLFVSSRGFLKSCDYHSNTPYSSITYLLDYPNISELDKCDVVTIHICGSAIPYFKNNLLNKIKNKIILVSGDCDENIPTDVLSHNDLMNFINNEQIIHWFSQNLVISHPKMTIIPIGMDYHTMVKTTIWGEITSPFEQEKILLEIKNKSKPFWERDIKCYSNFHFAMTTRYGYDRKDAIKEVPKELVYYEPNKIERKYSWNNQTNHAFVLSPHGGGFDCHRTWEALILGCIVIVKKSPIDELFKDLPVLIIDKWSDVKENLLKETVEKYKTMTFNYEKLTLVYWLNLINSYKK